MSVVWGDSLQPEGVEATARNFGSVLLVLYECVTETDRVSDLSNMLASWFEEDPNSRLLVPLLEQHCAQAWKAITAFAESDPNSSLWFEQGFADLAALRDHLTGRLNAEDETRFNAWAAMIRQDTSQTDPLLIRLYDNEAPTLALLQFDACSSSLTFRQHQHDFEALVADFMAENFQLTASEVLVLKHLMIGGTLIKVAQRLGKSVETIRSQTKALAGKLDVNSQSGILRLGAQASGYLSGLPSKATSAGAQSGQHHHQIQRPDGRMIHYEISTWAYTRSVLFVHGNAEGRHVSQSIMDLAKDKRLRLILVSRAGNGESNINPKLGAELLADHVRDYIAVLDAEDISATSILSQEDGIAVAYNIALKYPDRARQIVALEPLRPILKYADTRHLGAVLKTLALTALYSPKVLQFLTGLAMRSLAKRIQENERTNPVTKQKFEATEDDAFQTEIKNDSALVAQNGEGIWRDYSIAVLDWLTAPPGTNHIPRCDIVFCKTSPYLQEGAFDVFGKKLGAEMHRVDGFDSRMHQAMSKAIDLVVG